MAFRILYDAAGLSVAFKAANDVVGGLQGFQEGQARAGMTQSEINALTTQKRRDMRDIRREGAAAIGSRRAYLAAVGAEGTASEVPLTEAPAREFSRTEARVSSDYEVRKGVLQARRENYNAAAYGSLFSGLTAGAVRGKTGQSMQSLLG